MGAPTKWKYEVLELREKTPKDGYTVPWNDIATVKTALNRLGQEGWELVNAVPRADHYGTTYTVVLFLKRAEQ